MTNDLTTTGNPRLSLIESMAAGYNMDPNKFAATIKATCIKGQCSNEQFAAFLMVAHKHRLNPVTKEIYAFPQDGGIQPIVSVDGWHKLANDHPAYDGVEYEDHIVDGKLVAITAHEAGGFGGLDRHDDAELIGDRFQRISGLTQDRDQIYHRLGLDMRLHLDT